MGNGMDSEKKGEHAWKNGERDGNVDGNYLLPEMELVEMEMVEMEMVKMAEMEMVWEMVWEMVAMVEI